jgi:hypothetical protein
VARRVDCGVLDQAANAKSRALVGVAPVYLKLRHEEGLCMHFVHLQVTIDAFHDMKRTLFREHGKSLGMIIIAIGLIVIQIMRRHQRPSRKQRLKYKVLSKTANPPLYSVTIP